MYILVVAGVEQAHLSLSTTKDFDFLLRFIAHVLTFRGFRDGRGMVVLTVGPTGWK